MGREIIEENFVTQSFATKFIMLLVVSAIMFITIFLCFHGTIAFGGSLPGAFYIWSIAFIGLEALHKATVLTAYLMSPFLALLTVSSFGYNNLEDSQLSESNIISGKHESQKSLDTIKAGNLFREDNENYIESGPRTPPRRDLSSRKAKQTWPESPIISNEEDNNLDDTSFSSVLFNGNGETKEW